MATVSTSFTVPCTIDRAVLAIQDTLNQFEWPVLEMSTSLIVAQGPKQSSWQLDVNLPRVATKLSPVGDQTKLDVSVTIVGMLTGNKKWLSGILGKFTNAISLRVQTESIAINPTVALGQGQGAPSMSVPSSAPSRDRAQQLMDLKSLLDTGALTEAEFAEEKARILNADRSAP